MKLRIRSIKPQFFLDSKILDLPPLARLLFIGLWCCADREGRMHYDPRELRRQVLPDETQSVFDEMFGALTAANLVRLYAVENSSYVDIPHFLAHQVPYHKEQPSIIPSREGSRPGKGRVKTLTRKGHDRSGAGAVIGAGAGAGEEQEGRGEEKDTPIPPSRSRAPVAVTGGFQNAWNAYPHHQQRSKRGAAWKLWVKAELEPLEANVRAHIEASRAGSDWTREGGRFVPAFQAWLNGRDFTEPPLVVDRPVSILSEKGQATVQAAQRWLNRTQEKTV